MRSRPLCGPLTKAEKDNGTDNNADQSSGQAPKGRPTKPIASQHGMGSLDSRCLTERHGGQRFRCSGHMWSPPPESNRRPHPYHGTTRNRCANRHFPRSRPTVGAKVIGSLPAQLCVHYKPPTPPQEPNTGQRPPPARPWPGAPRPPAAEQPPTACVAARPGVAGGLPARIADRFASSASPRMLREGYTGVRIGRPTACSHPMRCGPLQGGGGACG